MRNILLIILLTSTNSLHSYSQKSEVIMVNYITLKDTFLVNTIKRFITLSNTKDSLFAKQGYIGLSIGNKQIKEGVVSKSCFINIRFTPINRFGENFQPHFYTEIAGKLVAIHLMHLRGTINNATYNYPSLFKKLLYGNNSPEVIDNADVVVIDGGITVYYFKDSTKAPLVLAGQ